MISNRHIRHDWQRWLDLPQKSLKAACGSTTTVKYAGIPGITPQQIVLKKGNGKVVWGWCRRCCEAILTEMKDLPAPLPTSEKVAAQYRIVYNVAITVCGERDFSKRLYVPWENRETKFQSALNRHNFEMLERNRVCYLCRQPNVRAKSVIDHITPKVLGGTDEENNLAVVHSECNSIKSGLPLNQVLPCFPEMQFPTWG